MKVKKQFFGFLLGLVVFVIVGSGCNNHRKVLKSDDPEFKYEKAVEYYEKGDYFRAIQLFSELQTYFRGTQRAEEIYYYYAYAHYGQGNYILASYFFQNFTRTFPRSRFAEETMFMAAYCQYLEAPKYSLDQTNTRNAINGMQAFINKHPESERVAQANELIDKLRAKLQRKSFENARLYLTLQHFPAAISAFQTHLFDYPDSEFKEQIFFLTFKAHYLFASKSVEARQKERFSQALDAYNIFAVNYPESIYMREAQTYYNATKNALESFKN